MPASLDLVDVDSLLTSEEVDVRETARRFADERLRPSLPQWFETGSIPARDLAKELGSLGFLGMHLTGYGCAGVSSGMTSIGVWHARTQSRDTL